MVEQAACAALCSLFRANRRCEQRKTIANQIITDFAKGSSSRLRLVYLDMCVPLMLNFSQKFFKEQFFLPAVDLCQV